MSDVYTLGQVVPLTFYVYDEDGYPANPTSASLTITKPDASTATPTLVNDETGVFTNDYTPAATGRYVAVFTATGTNAGTVVTVFDVQAVLGSVITLTQVKDYLGVAVSTSHGDAKIQAALDAERAAQARACDLDDYGPDLREALYRRVAVNLASRSVPLAEFTALPDGGGFTTRATGSDAVVRRLEAPYRKMVVA